MVLKNELRGLYKLTLTAIEISLQSGRTNDLSGLISTAKDLVYEIESLPEDSENPEKENFTTDDIHSIKGDIKNLENLEEMFKKIFSKVK